MVIDLLGLPKESEINKFSNKKVKSYLREMRASSSARGLAERLPAGVDPLAIDLISKMLKFDPDKRISTAEAMRHPYMRDIHSPDGEQRAPPVEVFDFEFEKYELSTLELKGRIHAR